MKKYIKNILTDNVWWIFTAITLIFFGTLYKMEFAVDTYATLSFTMKEFINQFASSGRFLLIFVGIIFKILNFNNKTIYILSYLMAIMCMVISLYKLYSIIKEDIGSKFLKILIPILIVLMGVYIVKLLIMLMIFIYRKRNNVIWCNYVHICSW